MLKIVDYGRELGDQRQRTTADRAARRSGPAALAVLGAVVVCVALIPHVLSGAELLHLDDFQDGSTQGWENERAPGPANVAAGGPAGDSDRFLMITATGGGGPGSRLAAFNAAPVWTGDYANVGATAIELDMMNPATSPVPLAMRVVLFGPNSTNNRWTSAISTSVPNDGQWRHFSFPVDGDDLTRVRGNAQFDDTIQDVVLVMFRHDAGTPSAQGSIVTASLGIDNVTLMGGISNPCDFNNDGLIDINDVDLLLAEVKASTDVSQFDVNQDGVVNQGDISFYIGSPDKLNTYIGDANLDGEFNSTDLVAVFQAGEYEDDTAMNSAWSSGDWGGDGDFGSSDLVFAFQDGGFEQGPRVPVGVAPEPSGLVLLLMGLLALSARRRR